MQLRLVQPRSPPHHHLLSLVDKTCSVVFFDNKSQHRKNLFNHDKSFSMCLDVYPWDLWVIYRRILKDPSKHAAFFLLWSPADLHFLVPYNATQWNFNLVRAGFHYLFYSKAKTWCSDITHMYISGFVSFTPNCIVIRAFTSSCIVIHAFTYLAEQKKIQGKEFFSVNPNILL